MGKSNLKEKVSTTWNNVVLHWKTPALGKYVSYKEIIAYGVGGMGVQFVMFFCSLIALSATSFLVGNTIGIKPMHLQYMAVASTIIGFGITIGRLHNRQRPLQIRKIPSLACDNRYSHRYYSGRVRLAAI